MEQREKLIELLDGLSIDTHDDVISVVDWLLANGVVVLPCRCCECEHGRSDIFNDGYIVCGHKGVFMKQDDFCSCAKRKGGE